jgi:hypothetical protein
LLYYFAEITFFDTRMKTQYFPFSSPVDEGRGITELRGVFFIFPRREYSTQSRKAWVEMRGALFATMLFDVLPQYFDSGPASANQAVGAMPEYWLQIDAVQMPAEILAYEPGRDGF